MLVPHHHLIGNLINHYYINTNTIPTNTTIRQKKYIRTEHTSQFHPSNYYHLTHHYHLSILDGGVGCDGRVASKYGLLLGLRSMLVFELLTVSMPVARSSIFGDVGGGYDGS